MPKSSWMMDPTRSCEMPSCSAIDLAKIRLSSKIPSYDIRKYVGLKTYQHPLIHFYRHYRAHSFHLHEGFTFIFYCTSLKNTITAHYFNTFILILFPVVLQPMQAMASSFLRFLDHTQWLTTVGGTPLDEWSALRRDLYLSTHNTRHPAVFKPTISAAVQPQTYALECVAIGTNFVLITCAK
jgi:hypothetical protein